MSEQTQGEPTNQPVEASAAPDATDAPESAQTSLISAETPVLEWLVAVVGLVLVLSTLGFTFHRALQENSSPPDVTVEVEAVVVQGNGYLVTFHALNRGDTTAAAVTVEGELRQGTEEIELSTANLDYIPSHAERRGGLFFTHDPQQYELHLRATGYAEP